MMIWALAVNFQVQYLLQLYQQNLKQPENHDQTIHIYPVNGLTVILRFYG